ncbi:hypothetical protein KCV07_g8686, partial [Aureobasidium melanogenum]
MVFLADWEGKQHLFVYGVFGVQHRSSLTDSKKAIINELHKLLTASAGQVDMLVDESHNLEAEDKPHATTFVAYWLDVKRYESWAASSSVRQFWDNLSDDAGVWREVMTVPTSRYMFAANQDFRWGLTTLSDKLRASNDEGYWGVYRHRIGSKDDTFTSPYVTASKAKTAPNSRILDIPPKGPRNSNKIRLGRVRVDGAPNNICFVREGQRQPNVAQEELGLWLEKVAPHARSWIEHLDSRREKNGVLAFSTHVSQKSKLNDSDAAETDQLAYFLDLAHFEASGRAFKGHVQLRKTVMEMYGPGGPMEGIGKAELYVELLILKSNEFRAEYIGAETARLQIGRAVKRQRVLISNEYERKIDSMEERLHSIEALLTEANKMLHVLMNRQQLQVPADSTSSAPMHLPIKSVDDDSDQRTSFVGESSLLAHSRKARHDVERLLQSSPSLRNNLEIKSALEVLHSAMRHRSTDGFGLLYAVPSIEPTNLTPEYLPPYRTVLGVVHEAQASDSLFFLIWSPFFTPSEFLQLVDQLYKNLDTCSMATKTIVCGALHYMFCEYLTARKFPKDSLLWSPSKRFLELFEHCLRSYSMLSSPSTESILAVVFGASHAIQKGGHASAWPMVSMACTMVQALGWHRLSDQNPEQTQAQTILFWVIYYYDKCLSLRLGRSAVLRDKDITVGYPSEPLQSDFRGWYLWFRTMIEIASAHGLIYEQLYSPGSLKHSSQQRLQHVEELAAHLDITLKQNSGIAEETVYRRQYMSFLVGSNSVVIGCLHTLIYRAVVPPDSDILLSLDPRCLSAARVTIRSHLDMVDLIRFSKNGSANDYASWAILNCPFTPFIILFYSVIKSPNFEDLELLQNFTTSLKSMQLRSPEAIKDLRELCQAFLTLARQYVTASISDTNADTIDHQIDGPANNLNFTLPSGFEAWFSGAQNFVNFDWTI